jgi:uncharacterized phage protein (TIGR01671 family)
MKPIKFRIMLNEKSNNADQWVYYDALEFRSVNVNALRLETAGLFTGLQDKNGNDIYERDIITFEVENNSCWMGPRKGIIEFNYKNASFEINLPNGFLSINRGYDAYIGTLEIIGNIHENSELLEKK